MQASLFQGLFCSRLRCAIRRKPAGIKASQKLPWPRGPDAGRMECGPGNCLAGCRAVLSGVKVRHHKKQIWVVETGCNCFLLRNYKFHPCLPSKCSFFRSTTQRLCSSSNFLVKTDRVVCKTRGLQKQKNHPKTVFRMAFHGAAFEAGTNLPLGGITS